LQKAQEDLDYYALQVKIENGDEAAKTELAEKARLKKLASLEARVEAANKMQKNSVLEKAKLEFAEELNAIHRKCIQEANEKSRQLQMEFLKSKGLV
jgi:hypothetical protein